MPPDAPAALLGFAGPPAWLEPGSGVAALTPPKPATAPTFAAPPALEEFGPEAPRPALAVRELSAPPEPTRAGAFDAGMDEPLPALGITPASALIPSSAWEQAPFSMATLSTQSRRSRWILLMYEAVASDSEAGSRAAAPIPTSASIQTRAFATHSTSASAASRTWTIGHASLKHRYSTTASATPSPRAAQDGSPVRRLDLAHSRHVHRGQRLQGWLTVGARACVRQP